MTLSFSRYYSVVGRRSTSINTYSMPHYPPKIPIRLAWNWTLSSAIRGWQLIATNEDDHKYYDDDNFEEGILQMKWNWTLVWNAKYVQRQLLMVVFQDRSASVLHTVFSLRSRTGLFVCLFVCFHGRPCTAACWYIVPPALDVPTLATRWPRAYRRVPHSSEGSWNLWAGIRTDNFA
jgi:hypothetical protein